MFKFKIILLIFPVIFAYSGCIKFSNLTNEDEKIIMTEKDVFIDLYDYAINPASGGRNYLFNKTVNRFGLYSMYSIRLIGKNNINLTLRVTADKFYNPLNAEKLYNGDAVMKKIYKNAVQSVDLSEFSCDDGFYIKAKDLFIFDLKKGKIFYSVQIEGENDVKLDDIKEAIKEKLANFESYTL